MEQSTEGRWERPDAPLGTLIFRAGLLSKEKLESALVEGRRTGKRLGEVLLQKGWIDEKDLARLVAGQKGIAFVSLRGRGFDKDAAKLLPERLCRGADAIAIEDNGTQVVIAVADPTDDAMVAEMREALGRPLELVVATASEIHAVLDEVFLRPEVEVPLIGEFGLRLAAAPSAESPEPPQEPVADPPAPAPVAEEPVAEEPFREISEPVAEEPAVEPVLEILEPVAEHPVVSEPVIEVIEHVVEEPVIEEPVVEVPEPVVEIAEPVAVAPVEVLEPVIEVPEPVAVEAEPAVVEPAAEYASLRPAAIELPKLQTTPVEHVEPHVEIVGIDQPTVEPEPEPLPQNDAVLGIANPSEPTIERNEDAHVSLAFHPPASVEPEPAREPEPAPPVEAENEIQMPPPEEALGWRIVLNLSGDEEIDVAFFASEPEANAAARELVAGISQDGEWPQVGRKFIPPERITSVEVRERARFGGSTDRAGWAT